MARVQIVDPKSATGPARALLDVVQEQLGLIPNLTRVLANSPKALEGFLGLFGAASDFALDVATRERIALTVAEGNGCQYCVSAHTAIGRRSGLSSDEMLLNRRGQSGDARAAAAVAFARRVNDSVGEVSASEFAAARAAGLSDAEVVEIISLVALNFYTNVLCKTAHVDIDFPPVALLDHPLRAAA